MPSDTSRVYKVTLELYFKSLRSFAEAEFAS